LGVRLAVLSTALLAAGPWHIPISQTGFRDVLLPMMVMLAVIAAERRRSRHLWFLVIGVPAGLAMDTYSAAPLFVPPVAAWIWRCRRELRYSPGFALGGTANAAAVTVPGARDVVGLAHRFGAPHTPDRGQPVAVSHQLLSQPRPRFSVLQWDPNLRHTSPAIVQHHLEEIANLAAGAIVLLRGARTTYPWIVWVLASPLTAAVTEPDQARRSIVLSIGLAVASAMGFASLTRLASCRVSTGPDIGLRLGRRGGRRLLVGEASDRRSRAAARGRGPLSGNRHALGRRSGGRGQRRLSPGRGVLWLGNNRGAVSMAVESWPPP
jgi:hypothetical protein